LNLYYGAPHIPNSYSYEYQHRPRHVACCIIDTGEQEESEQLSVAVLHAHGSYQF
jgi:hypothetical protein